MVVGGSKTSASATKSTASTGTTTGQAAGGAKKPASTSVPKINFTGTGDFFIVFKEFFYSYFSHYNGCKHH
jgi:hypothetical protein